MDINQLLALPLDIALENLKENGCQIEKIDYLNEPPGSKRLVRVQKISADTVNILAAFHYDPLEKE